MRFWLTALFFALQKTDLVLTFCGLTDAELLKHACIDNISFKDQRKLQSFLSAVNLGGLTPLELIAHNTKAKESGPVSSSSLPVSSIDNLLLTQEEFDNNYTEWMQAITTTIQNRYIFPFAKTSSPLSSSDVEVHFKLFFDVESRQPKLSCNFCSKTYVLQFNAEKKAMCHKFVDHFSANPHVTFLISSKFDIF